MAKAKTLAPIVLIPFLVCIAGAQDKIVSKAQNLPKIIRLWGSMADTSRTWNQEMERAHALIRRRFDARVLDSDPDASRKQTVAHYKAAREALLKDLDTLNELIEEDDY